MFKIIIKHLFSFCWTQMSDSSMDNFATLLDPDISVNTKSSLSFYIDSACKDQKSLNTLSRFQVSTITLNKIPHQLVISRHEYLSVLSLDTIGKVSPFLTFIKHLATSCEADDTCSDLTVAGFMQQAQSRRILNLIAQQSQDKGMSTTSETDSLLHAMSTLASPLPFIYKESRRSWVDARTYYFLRAT
jgi:hypothetical protein